MPDPSDTILDMIQRNPGAFQPQPAQEEPQAVNVEAPGGAAAYYGQGGWSQLRSARANRALMNPGFQDSLAAHHAAVADTQALDHAAATELGLYHAARMQHDTAAFHQAVHGMDPTDPQYENNMLGLAASYPFAKPDAELMQPLHEARKRYLDANSAIVQRRQEEQDSKHIYDAIEKGHLTMDDFAKDASGKPVNPSLYGANGQIDVRSARLLAASRAGANVGLPNLNETERALVKVYGSPDARTSAYSKLYKKAAAGDRDAQAANDTIWNVWKKAGLATKSGASSPTAAPTNPLYKF